MTGGVLTYPFDALVSFHYFRTETAMRKVTDHGRLRLIADSGAFSAFTQGATVDLAEYAEWAKQWRSHLFWIAALDVLGDPQATWNNWHTLLNRHALPTVPTLHIGGDVSWLDRYAAEGVDFVGLGGMVGIPADQQLRWLVHVLRYARDRHPGMRFHAWGMTKFDTLAKLPVFSADSSGPLGAAYRFGQMQLWDSRRRRIVGFRLDARAPYRHTRLLMDQYGVVPAQVERSHSGNRQLLIQLGAASLQRMGLTLQRLHKVAAPTWGVNPAWAVEPGPRLHAAEPPKDLATVAGPRIHGVDATPRHLALITQEQEANPNDA